MAGGWPPHSVRLPKVGLQPLWCPTDSPASSSQRSTTPPRPRRQQAFAGGRRALVVSVACWQGTSARTSAPRCCSRAGTWAAGAQSRAGRTLGPWLGRGWRGSRHQGACLCRALASAPGAFPLGCPGTQAAGSGAGRWRWGAGARFAKPEVSCPPSARRRAAAAPRPLLCAGSRGVGLSRAQAARQGRRGWGARTWQLHVHGSSSRGRARCPSLHPSLAAAPPASQQGLPHPTCLHRGGSTCSSQGVGVAGGGAWPPLLISTALLCCSNPSPLPHPEVCVHSCGGLG